MARAAEPDRWMENIAADARKSTADADSAQRRVAELAAGGRTNKEIAQTLFVTLKTVELHLSHAYRKLGIRSRRDLERALAG